VRRGSDLRVVVTGAKGMLGSDMCEVLGTDYDVSAYDIEDFDITDSEATLQRVGAVAPQIIIHLAAFTDVEACEDETDKAVAVNAVGAMNVAKAARQSDAYLVYISTDYVFDGAKRKPYVETDEPSPINRYGLTKLHGERHVQDLTRRHLIIRTSWLFGPNGKNFIDTILAKASKGGVLEVVDDQRGCPTYTMDLARGIRQAIECGITGIMHMTNAGDTTWFGLAEYAVRLAGIATEIIPVLSERYPTKARRPSYSVLGSVVTGVSGVDPLPRWEEGVKHHLKRRSILREGARS
jgi:dTDP-4-dehydrorhamnose reductase